MLSSVVDDSIVANATVLAKRMPLNSISLSEATAEMLKGETKTYPVYKIAIEELLSTNSNVCILTMQDILFEGSESRINTPGTCKNNWIYKLRKDYKKSDYNKYLKNLIKLKNR